MYICIYLCISYMEERGLVFEAAPANPPRAPSRPEVPHLRSKAKCAKVKITKSKSQIEDPKLNNSYIIYLNRQLQYLGSAPC